MARSMLFEENDDGTITATFNDDEDPPIVFLLQFSFEQIAELADTVENIGPGAQTLIDGMIMIPDDTEGV